MGNANLEKERIGVINKNMYGSTMEVVEYINNRDILVQFDKGKPVHTRWEHFCDGKVRNLYDKTVHGIGYIGEGGYIVRENGKITKRYTTWAGMLTRCYDKKLHERHPTYKNCSVDELWYNYQNFAKWYEENYYDCGETMCLDKDILIKGNKVYSAETSIFVPQRINKLFAKKETNKRNFPIGVYFKSNKYKAYLEKGKEKSHYIGTFDTPEEAFQAYKISKEEIIKQVAEEYKHNIPEKLYNAMVRYKVEIND